MMMMPTLPTVQAVQLGKYQDDDSHLIRNIFLGQLKCNSEMDQKQIPPAFPDSDDLVHILDKTVGSLFIYLFDYSLFVFCLFVLSFF